MSSEFFIEAVKDRLCHIGVLIEQEQFYPADFEPELSIFIAACEKAQQKAKEDLQTTTNS